MNRLHISLAAMLTLGILNGCQIDNLTSDATRSHVIIAVFDDHGTKTTFQGVPDSYNLLTKWQGHENIKVFYMMTDTYSKTVPVVKVSEITEDGSGATFSYAVPDEWDKSDSYDVKLFTTTCLPEVKNGKLYYNASIIREAISTFQVPVYSEGEISSEGKLNAIFHHYYTYELLHIKNNSGADMEFSLLGFEAGTTWFREKGSLCLEDGTFVVDAPSTKPPVRESSPIVIMPHGEDIIVSAYIPNGQKIHDAVMVARINGQDVHSANKKSSEATLQPGHAYHMYATWDGKELRFDEMVGSMTLSTTEIDFGEVEYGTDETEKFTVSNTGNGMLTFSISCECHDNVFEVDDGAEQTLAPGASKEFTVTAHGMKRGNSASCYIRVLSDAEDGTQTVLVKAEGWDDNPLTLESSSITVPVNGEGEVDILFGSLDYDLANNNPDIVRANIATSGSGGGGRYDSWKSTSQYVRVEGLSKGTAKLVITDKERNETCTLTVTVTDDAVAIPDIVDLGLSVKWASFNLGATKPEESGDYYAWGETETKEEYKGSNYKFGYLSDGYHLSYGYHTLAPEDDVARAILGEGWRIPTKAEWVELITKCDIRKYDDNSTWQFIAANGASIILPAAGRIHYGNELVDDNDGSFYWSSTISKEGTPYYYTSNYYGYHRPTTVDGSYGGPNFDDGFSVRAVYGGPPSVTSIVVSSTDEEEYDLLGRITTIENPHCTAGSTISQTFSIYNEGDVDLTVLVMDPVEEWYYSGDETSRLSYYSVPEQDKKFTLPPFEGKNVVVNYTPLSLDDNKDGLIVIHSDAQEGSASIRITGEGGVPITQGSIAEPVDLGLSVKWASWNLGASKESDGGNYYAWGELDSKMYYNWETYKYYDKTSASITKYNESDHKTLLTREDDAASAKWGDSWRIPTAEEYEELKSKCTVEWTSIDGVFGNIYTGPNGNHIFLPARGYIVWDHGVGDNIIYEYDTIGSYWFANIERKYYDNGQTYVYYEEGCTGYVSDVWIINFDIYSSVYGARCNGKLIRPVYDDSE